MDQLDPVFRALGDPSRRLLLDRLFERDGQTLGSLCEHLPAMTRFGVMRHLAVLEEAGLVTTRRVGRKKLHYLNPVPIRRIHDRWIGKYAAVVVGAMSALATHLEAEMTASDRAPDHVYIAYVRATPERIWRAITDGDDTARYYYGTRVESDWTVGAAVRYTYPDGTLVADGVVLEIDPPRRLRMTFHAHWDPEFDAEGPVESIWELEPAGEATKLTAITRGLRAGSRMATDFASGEAFIVSGLKTLVETGEPMVPGRG